MRLIKGKTYYTKPWYGSYHSMMDRCYREKSCNYNRYGARGIRVCEEWHNIENFEKWVDEIDDDESPNCYKHKLNNQGEFIGNEPAIMQYINSVNQNEHS